MFGGCMNAQVKGVTFRNGLIGFCLVGLALGCGSHDPNTDRRKETSGGLVPTETERNVAAGTTQGNFRVTSDGAGSYSIPLWVSPGRAGIQPELTLEYNSRSGNGPLGVGWALQGLSQITRCRRTFPQD